MIQEILTHTCRKCGSENITRNGHNRCGSAQYHCHDCNFFGVLEPKVPYTEDRKAEILKAYQERPSMRGISRVYGVARQTLAQWIKKSTVVASTQRNFAGSTTR
jgi:transposase-like protein